MYQTKFKLHTCSRGCKASQYCVRNDKKISNYTVDYDSFVTFKRKKPEKLQITIPIQTKCV